MLAVAARVPAGMGETLNKSNDQRIQPASGLTLRA
jgi:hypothetical protein